MRELVFECEESRFPERAELVAANAVFRDNPVAGNT